MRVVCRGKAFYTTREVLENCEYFRNLFDFRRASAFADANIEEEIVLDISPYAFAEILKHLENNLYCIPPEYCKEANFFLLECVRDKIVVRTDSKLHYLNKSALEKFSKEVQKTIEKEGVLDIPYCTESAFEDIKNFLQGVTKTINYQYYEIAGSMGILRYKNMTAIMINGKYFAFNTILFTKYPKLKGKRNMIFDGKQKYIFIETLSNLERDINSVPLSHQEFLNSMK